MSRRAARSDAPVELRFAVDGKLRVLDLASVRERLGSHWPRYADSVFLLAEKVVRRELGPKDRLSRRGDALTIAFDAPNTRAAMAAQAKITKTLTELLFGDGMFADAVPRHPPAAARRRAPDRARGGFFHWLGSLFRRSRTSAPASDANDSPDDAAESAAAESAETAAPTTAASELEFVDGASGPSIGAPRARARPPSGGTARPAMPLTRFASGTDEDIRQIEWAISQATLRLARANTEFGAAAEERLSHVRFTYRPLWHVPSRALVGYRCTPAFVDQEDVIEGDGVLLSPTSLDQCMVLDQLALTNVIVDLEAMLTKNLDSIIVVPLHFTSFTADWSSGILSKLCSHIPTEARKRLVIEIVDAATGRTDARFPAVARALKPYCTRVGAVVPLRTRDMRYWSELGFLTAAVDLADWEGQEEDLLAELDRFALAARRDAIKAVAMGLKSRSLILAAATMGFEFVHGTPISHLAAMGVMERVPFDFADLYDG